MRGIILLLALLSMHSVHSLYEDQIGKFDWKQKFIGDAKFGFFDPTNADEIIVATRENVLASVRAKSGELLRRVVFEDDARGEVLLLQGPSDAGSHLDRDYDIITVTGRNPSIVRGWNTRSFNLEFEWSLNLINPAGAADVHWYYENKNMYHVIPVWGSHVEVTGYLAHTGQGLGKTATRFDAKWIRKESCIFAGSNLACLSKDSLVILSLRLTQPPSVRTVAVAAEGAPIEHVAGCDCVRVKNKIFWLTEEREVNLKSQTVDSVVVEPELGDHGTLIEISRENSNLKVISRDLQTLTIIEELSGTNEYPATLGKPKILASKCKTKQSCRLLLSTSDESIVLLQQGAVKWTREESLANIDSVDFVDLALSDEEGELEEELKNKGGNLYSAFLRRISSQILHAKNVFFHILVSKPRPSATQKAGLVRDEFGLHKLIVAVTRSGKVFGIDNLTGKQHWVKHLPGFVGFNDDVGLKLVTQRTSKYYPKAPQCAVVGKQRSNGNGAIFIFNPLNGQPRGQGVFELPYKIQQFTLLSELDSNSLRGLLLLDTTNRPHVIPDFSRQQAHGLYVYTADKQTGQLAGYYIQYENSILQAIPTWRINVGGVSNQQKIIKIASKNSIEHVHSQGRVLADRSVLYKYLNPNLVAVVTQGNDPIHKVVLNIHLIDVVSGATIFSMSHRRAKGPVSIVHSENWLTYSFFNEKVRRFEVTAIELYEGKTQSNSTAWSSLGSPPLPLVERQIYIMPANISVLRETITEKGITNKHILFGLTTGSILEMSWALLDPRRPSTNPEKAREEGIIPYIPELPIPSESLVNYNQTVERLRGIHTAPSGLESTCLVIAHGLDIFVTRVAPSKTFDLLKEDFDYFLISIVLFVLITASYITKHLASKKILKQAWK